MNFLKTTAASAIVFAMVGTAASAATWDFDLDADKFYDDNGYEGTFDQVYDYLGGTERDGITVMASAQLHDGTTQGVHPFMDADGDRTQVKESNLGGLGVCSNGIDANDQSDCATGNPTASNTGDDNLVFPELLELAFSDRVFLRDLYIRDANHNPETGFIRVGSSALPTFMIGDVEHIGFVDLEINNGLVVNAEAAGFSDVFYFTSVGNDAGEEIYLSTLTASVPLPAAGWLLLGGLGGLAAMKRRKKAA